MMIVSKITSLANSLTALRLLLAPILLIVYYADLELYNFYALFIFLIAALTDGLDGYFARKLNQATSFGAFLDPIADKLMVIAALIALSFSYDNLHLTMLTLFIFFRESIISFLRVWFSVQQSGQLLKVNLIGKIKTIIQMVSILLLFFVIDIQNYQWVSQYIQILSEIRGDLLLIGLFGLYISVFFSMFSLAHYLIILFKDYRQST